MKDTDKIVFKTTKTNHTELRCEDVKLIYLVRNVKKKLWTVVKMAMNTAS